jgi:hypothetical protein
MVGKVAGPENGGNALMAKMPQQVPWLGKLAKIFSVTPNWIASRRRELGPIQAP